MSSPRIQLLGTGDAFAAGGRLQTCFHLRTSRTQALIDCGATSLAALRRHGLNPNDLDLILLSHLHGDHFGGLPFLLISARLADRRRRALTIAGPPGVEARLKAAMEVFFPGSSGVPAPFRLRFAELRPGRPRRLRDLTVSVFEVSHPSGAPSHALRVRAEGRTITYTGDTEWTETLPRAARGADLLIAECYTYERSVRYHSNYKTWMARRDELGCRCILFTHMSEDMLARLPGLEGEFAADGLTIDL